jgi:DNA-binding NarL/FixJ family response regulator
MTGTAAIPGFLAQLPNLKILMHTVHDDSDQLFASIKAGATGYLLKSSRPDKLLEAVTEAAAGGAPLSPALARRMVDFFRQQAPPTNPLDALTAREREILEQLAKGQLYKEISADLGLSYSTVRTHIEHIYQKLRVNTKAAAIAQFNEHQN